MSARAAGIAAPGIAWGAYPERGAADTNAWAQMLTLLQSRLRLPVSLQARRHQRFVERVHAHAPMRELAGLAFDAKVSDLRARLAAKGFTESLAAESFALVREATRRTLGKAQFDTQLIAGWIMLGNRLAEMQTGEGKTLAALLPVATAALAGIPVHVITANDYLVARDAQLQRPVYEALGLTVGAVTQTLKDDERRAAYECDVTYCTAKELVFDYLRDRLALGKIKSDLHRRIAELDATKPNAAPLLRGLCMAVIDEADSILIDEARTPLILSQSHVNAQEAAHFHEAMRLTNGLQHGRDFRCDPALHTAELTQVGRDNLRTFAVSMSGIWQDPRRREEIVCLALAAKYLFRRDRDYLVREGKVLIIDATTGRIADGRVWSRGLQQLIELKEGCAMTGKQQTIAQITYQRFFPRYLRLCGMSGTLSESRGELRSVYGLRVAAVPLRNPSKRVWRATQVYMSTEAKWRAVVARCAELHRAGQPVLVGTDSVADSELLASRLQAQGLAHTVLNARFDREEAEIVAQAGAMGRITIATNMAGRGTDIALGAGVTQRGGLHVLSCQLNDSRRIDRQLHGRCARQGDPGSVETILSMEDRLIARYLPKPWRAFLVKRYGADGLMPSWLASLLRRAPQRLTETRQWLERWQLSQHDAALDRKLSFGSVRE
jgi:preprotein translocase subunit SecA